MIPVDAEQIGADILSAQAYKHLLGGFGIAGLLLLAAGPARVAGFRARLGGPRARDLSRRVTSIVRSPRKRDASRQAIPHSRPSADSGRDLRLLVELLPRGYQQRIAALTTELVEGLEERGWVVASSRRAEERSSVVAASRPGADLEALYRARSAERVAFSLRNGRLRFSPHFYNNSDDVARLLAFLEDAA